MRNLKKLSLPILLILAVLLALPLISALEITDTTFHSNLSNYTIFVDRVILDQVTVTNWTIEFYNLTSENTNFTNTNETYDARADFYDLLIGLTVRNINTSTDLFTSASGAQSYNATFTSFQVLRIMSAEQIEEEEACSALTRIALNLTVGFFALLILFAVIVLIYNLVNRKEEVNIKAQIVVFVALIVGIVLVRIIAENANTLCG